MNLLKITLLCFLLSSSLFAGKDIVKIGVLSKRGYETTMLKWSATARYLSRNIPGKNFIIKPLAFEAIYTATANKEIDFVLTNSGMYIELEAIYKAQAIATLINKHHSGALEKEFGGLIFTHKDNKEKFKTIEDLTNVTFGAVNKKSLGGWQMAWKEFLDHDIDVNSDFKSLEFYGTHDKVVYAVLNKEVDVGTVRTDSLERMALEKKIDIESIHFINLKEHEAFPFHASTQLYPEWPMAKLKHTSDSLANRVAVALLEMKIDDNAAQNSSVGGWNTPISYIPVHECFKSLELPPYHQEIRFLDVVDKYRYWIIFYIFLALNGFAMLMYQFKLARNLKSTQSELIQTEKMASLGRLVAGISHEINTPIGVGVTASSHLKSETIAFNYMYKDETMTENDFENYIDNTLKTSNIILQNLSRAANLIQSFKQISVDQTSNDIRDFNIKEYINSVIESLKPELKHTSHAIELICDENLRIESNPGVFSQIISNMIMNSIIHGLENIENGTIIISVLRSHNELTIIYSDNGKGMNHDHLSKLFDPFFTTKRGMGGSGLGTHIIYNLVTQKLHGTIKATSQEAKGLTYTLKFKNIKFL